MVPLFCILRLFLVAEFGDASLHVCGQVSERLPPKADIETFTIGYLNTGDPFDSSVTSGIRRAIDEARRNPKYERQDVRLCVIDVPRPWQDMGSQLARVVFEKKITALIGPARGQEAHVAAQIVTRARIPVITLAGEDNLTQVRDPWVLRGIPSDFEQAKHLLRWSLEQTGMPTAYAVVSEGRNGREQMRSLSKAGQELGISLTFGRGLEELIQARPVTVVLWLDPGEAARWIKRLAERFQPKCLLGSLRLVHPEVIAAAAHSGLNLYVPCLADPSKAKDDRKSDLWETLGFDMASAIIRAAQSENRGGEDVLKALLNQDLIADEAGRFHFDAWGNRDGAMNIAVIRRSRLVCLPDAK